MREDIVIIGGGLAGSEAAWQAANHGAKVTLYEMRPKEMTKAHKTGDLAELVCSNSLGVGGSTTGARHFEGRNEATELLDHSHRGRSSGPGRLGISLSTGNSSQRRSPRRLKAIRIFGSCVKK